MRGIADALKMNQIARRKKQPCCGARISGKILLRAGMMARSE
jgi:hypothetical protein